MASHLWRELALNVVLHSLAGGLTDTVAVWMLFNPHKPFLGVQGAIPKNKARLASSIGKVVGEKLLTPQDMLQELTHGGIRDAFNERVGLVANSLLETERGSLRSIVPVAMSAELESALHSIVSTVAERIERVAEGVEPRLRGIAAILPCGRLLRRARRRCEDAEGGQGERDRWENRHRTESGPVAESVRAERPREHAAILRVRRLDAQQGGLSRFDSGLAPEHGQRAIQLAGWDESGPWGFSGSMIMERDLDSPSCWRRGSRDRHARGAWLCRIGRAIEGERSSSTPTISGCPAARRSASSRLIATAS